MCGLRLVALRKWTYKHKIHQTYYQISKSIYPFYSSLLRRDVYVPTAFLPPSLASFVHLAEAQGVCHAYSAAHPISCKILLQVSLTVSTTVGPKLQLHCCREKNNLQQDCQRTDAPKPCN